MLIIEERTKQYYELAEVAVGILLQEHGQKRMKICFLKKNGTNFLNYSTKGAMLNTFLKRANLMKTVILWAL
ncbi:MAG: hypothetical protein DRI73_11740 [Bacteroidetes bacterium]|nr:MAG: hypothetical protein DRI73_11740 [Bacteroidota bacterium]